MIDIVEMLRTEGPMDTDTIARRLRVPTCAARRRLAEMAGIERRMVCTPRNRAGISVWFAAGESVARVDAVAKHLNGKPQVFNLGPRDRRAV